MLLDSSTAQLDWCGFFAYRPRPAPMRWNSTARSTAFAMSDSPNPRASDDTRRGNATFSWVRRSSARMSQESSSHREALEIDGVVVVPDTLEVGDFHDLTVTATMGPDVEHHERTHHRPREVGITPRPTCSRSPVSSLPCSSGSCSTPMPTEASWAAFGLGIALAVTDFFDGRVARRSNVVSRSGAFLDPLADKIVVIGGAYCLVYVERWWCRSRSSRYASSASRPIAAAGRETGWRCRPNLGQVQDLRAGTRTHPGGDADARESRHRDRRVVVGRRRLDDLQRGAVSPRWAKRPEHHRRLTPEASGDPLGGTHVNDLAEVASEM